MTEKRYRRCRLVVRCWEDKSLHPLHLVTDKIKWLTQQQQNDKENKDQKTIALVDKLQLSTQPHRQHLFSIVHLDNIPAQHDAEDDNETVMYCCKEFIKRYGPQLSENMYFTPVEPFQLDRVVLAATTKETFEWTNKKEFSRAIMVANTEKRTILAREEDVFLSEANRFYGSDVEHVHEHFMNLRVLSCSPWKQGKLGEKTEIVIVCLPPSQHSPHQEEEDSIGEDENKLYAISLSEAPVWAVEKVVKVFVHPVPYKHYVDQQEQIDLDDYLVSRIMKIAMTTDTVHMSPTSWFNLTGEDFRHRLPQSSTVQTAEFDEDEVVFARELHISLVVSPNYNSSCDYLKLIHQALNIKPMLCKVGDIITFDTTDNANFYLNAADKTLPKCRHISFKVLAFASDEISPQPYLVDAKHTRIYQESPTNGYSPYPNPHTAPGMQHHVDKLKSIITPYLHRRMGDEDSCTVLVSGVGGCGKSQVITCACEQLSLHHLTVDCFQLISDSPGAGEAKLQQAFTQAMKYLPCVLILDGVGNLTPGGASEHGRMVEAFEQVVRSMSDELVLVATARDKSQLSSDVCTLLTHHMEIDPPDEEGRMSMLSELCSDLKDEIGLKAITKSTPGFTLSDLSELVGKSRLSTYERVIKQAEGLGTRLPMSHEQVVCMSGFKTIMQDFTQALNLMQHEKADKIGLANIPNVSWEDIGGLDQVKTDILDTVQLPLDFPQLAAGGLNRSGVLLYGPPGTGKTLLAKAVASQCQLSFLSVKGPELINMYVGQSESNVREVFQRARNAAPCVVFFDELDALAPNRGRSGDSGGVMDRIVSQLLAELDGIDDNHKQVFVIAASNRPDLIDPALLRPGRFEKLIYVGVNEDKNERMKILLAQTRHVNLHSQVDLESVLEACQSGMTGADFRALVNEATMNGIRRCIVNNDHESECYVMQDDLLLAAHNTTPSVTSKQLDNYKQIHQTMSK